MQTLSVLKDKFLEPLSVLATKENVIIVQIHPKRRVIALSYKRTIKTAQFQDNSIKNMLKGGMEFRKNAEPVIIAIAQLLEQLIQGEYMEDTNIPVETVTPEAPTAPSEVTPE